jgi:hypothetical protein
MTLGDKQRLFARLVARLIRKAHALGYGVTLGHALRSKQEAKRLGMEKSLHTKKLAIDLNLFRKGKYLTSTKSHEPLGLWWEKQHELARWGGRFGDGNHYSLTHGGRK